MGTLPAADIVPLLQEKQKGPGVVYKNTDRPYSYFSTTTKIKGNKSSITPVLLAVLSKRVAAVTCFHLVESGLLTLIRLRS